MKKILYFLGIGFIALALFGCSVKVSDVTLDTEEIILKVGESANLIATIHPLDASDKDVKWYTSDYEIVRVSSEGVVKAIKDGEAIITVITNNGVKSATAKIIVNSLPVEGIDLDNKVAEVLIFNRIKLKATITPYNVYNKKVIWESSDELIAEVTANGLVITKGVGEVTITARSDQDETIFDECTITVKAIDVESIELNVNEDDLQDGVLKMAIDDTYDLKYIINPTDATNKEVSWTSSNPDVISVDQDGVLTAHRVLLTEEDAVIITITTLDGEFTDELEVEVYFQDLVSIDFAENATDSAELFEGESHQLTIIFNPTNASDKDIVYSIEEADEEYLTIDENGYITAIKADGEAVKTVVVTAKNIAFDKTTTVNIKIKPVIAVESITFNETEKEVHVGDKFFVTPDVLPTNATNKNVVWTSDDVTVATVDDNGNIEALKMGETIIRGTTVDGEFVAQLELSVLDVISVTGIAFEEDNIEMFVGENLLKANVIITPEDATNKTLHWTSNNDKIVDINAGLLTAVAPGVVKITVRTADGNFIAECMVIVKPVIKVTSIKLDKSTATLEVEDTLALVATVNPTNATNKTITWTSSNEDFATVDENGVVTAVATGSTTITAKTNEGNFSVACTIIVA